uniref:Uncharacterized protein n=1 Tax=Anguilla anguilla TaxID=7936 RepID=A0A0E9QCW8_ANGAN
MGSNAEPAIFPGQKHLLSKLITSFKLSLVSNNERY